MSGARPSGAKVNRIWQSSIFQKKLYNTEPAISS
ncbi:hypothetical protein EYZ11_008704 [Aspergillus tanneri]|uniref:Uncharacterized protein n=1 Tax=Aspergillus tanneri TaxID=1220188 RepID=A0A4V3UNN7_9EURO|nr:hypothetical protein EYZ11_008704 [Aspergillus tanneri]